MFLTQKGQLHPKKERIIFKPNYEGFNLQGLSDSESGATEKRWLYGNKGGGDKRDDNELGFDT